MIKTYFLDILTVILVGIIALLAVQRPVLDLNVRPALGDKRQPPQTKKEETKNVPKEIVRDIAVSDLLKERNIFAADGKYSLLTSGGAIGEASPEKSYSFTLIGILDGEERRAVIREGTGPIAVLMVGKKLSDGSVITRIDNRAVEVKKGDEKRELKMFNVKAPPLRRISP